MLVVWRPCSEHVPALCSVDVIVECLALVLGSVVTEAVSTQTNYLQACNRREVSGHHDDRERHKAQLCRDLPREKGEAFEVWVKELLDAGHGEGDEDASWSDTSWDKTLE